ncbi:FAD-dependent monooxygenase [Krasilnikoviella flava]|uniref:2-polyprenyl-6-methoxyphenol hydroxylase n=1 Tax=Krasilnikoviella flava TaxID=526729 RepID=A0A1T5KYZ7_9MICO|nr:FAD-dependent monooxygenase [Krasilnikoviella flava]SKC68695.1 2-polyprenyl-6-methoxyphenol hydroxylase [Krasilnikoviella flava]
MAHTAVVVGGGIGGLASAVSLATAGWRTTVLERARELGEVGAGVALTPNAVAALGGLGLDADAVAALGPRTWATGTWDARGRPILRLPDDPDLRASTVLRGVHRARLHGALLARARALGVEVVTDARVTTVAAGDPVGAPAVVRHADRAGTERERQADLVVGADGVRSAVRAALFDGRGPVYSGYSSWRAIVPGLEAAGQGLLQYWGPHAEFGTMPVSDGATYWYGYVRMPEGTRVDDEHGAAVARFAGWADEVRRVIAATPPEAVLRHDVLHLPGGLPRYVRGRVVMVGDAAHATLPTMAQGAATALEDGVCVGRVVAAGVAAGAPLGAALAAYDAARRPRCRALARASVASGRFGSHLGPRWQGLRNALMRRVPAAAVTRGARAVMGWTPPALP